MSYFDQLIDFLLFSYVEQRTESLQMFTLPLRIFILILTDIQICKILRNYSTSANANIDFQLATVHVNIIKIFLIHRAKQTLIINYTFHVKFMVCKMFVVIGESPLSTISGFSLMFLILVFIFVFSSDIDQFIFSHIIISEMSLIEPFLMGLTY